MLNAAVQLALRRRRGGAAASCDRDDASKGACNDRRAPALGLEHADIIVANSADAELDGGTVRDDEKDETAAASRLSWIWRSTALAASVRANCGSLDRASSKLPRAPDHKSPESRPRT